MEEKNLLDILLDPENEEPILLCGAEEQVIAFEQVAVIPYAEKLYCILAPVDPAALGAEEGEAIVFLVDAEGLDEPRLVIEEDEEISTAVFTAYEELLNGEE